ncbi:MAG: CHASE2 domain-containing protein [Bdellovibrionaceae bacterium]|nr:CHASE2 domain-containing protein [Pseudobdellovibrionaceae bacterium]MBX3035078.1 CHASE2 domain-containing protein [Pseudobdellovibrionaceae bacterium]
MCWAIGCLALSVDESKTYDRRFQLRGEQKAADEVVLLTLYPSDFLSVYGGRPYSLMNMSEITDITDSFFWDRKTWMRLLESLLKYDPRAIGVTLWFGENIGDIRLNGDERRVLENKKIIWATSINNVERMMNPTFARPDLSNIASVDLQRDDDGVVRRLFSIKGEVPSMVERLTGQELTSPQKGLVINYRGSQRQFAHYTLSELMNDEIPPEALAGKIILIGADTGSGPRYLTPVGPLPRAEIIAHLVDNQLHDRWIKRLNFFWYAAMFLLLTCLSVFLITAYPQSVALLFFWWIGTLCAALSAWAFDTFALWFPAFSPFILLAATWIIFIGYQATRIERLNQRLQQEQRYLQELEQLKNNFVSLISHDLKTPIAKIQAVVNRLRAQPLEEGLQQDLRSLHDSSEELNRYIQSILKLLRVESRDFQLHREVADINEVIEQVVRQLAPLASEKGLRIDTELEPMFSAEFDVTLMKEVVLNLVENAIKYSHPGGRIAIRSEEIDDLIRVEVQDNGPGIAADELDKVWRKFTRGKDQDLRTKGSGLGLYLVKYFIELHGGSVRLESQVGQGSTVSFTLPLVDDTPSGSKEEVLS